MEISRPGGDAKFSEIGSLFIGTFGGAQFVDQAVYVLLADALAVSFRAAVGVDVVPPRASFVVAECLADEFAHSAAFILGDGLGTLLRIVTAMTSRTTQEFRTPASSLPFR